MNITLTRSLNGVPKTHEEMKSYMFKSEAVANAIHFVNDRINASCQISPDDNQKLYVETQ